jgi:hypothetical protein
MKTCLIQLNAKFHTRVTVAHADDVLSAWLRFTDACAAAKLPVPETALVISDERDDVEVSA